MAEEIQIDLDLAGAYEEEGLEVRPDHVRESAH